MQIQPAASAQPVNPQMTVLARESRGLTQGDLATQIGVNQGHLSKVEAGVVPATDGLAERLAGALDYPASFLRMPESIYGPSASEFYHRKRQSVPNALLTRVHAQVNIRRIHIARLLKAASLDQESIPRLDPDEFSGGPVEIARLVRAVLNLPPGPVKNLTHAIEDAGGIVALCDFGTPLISGMSRWVPGMPPLFFLNRDSPGDRMRLTLAHELGHMVMHRLPGPEMEAEAFAFGAELLMPASEIGAALPFTTLPTLAALKPYWGVSIAALLRRAEELGKLEQRRARYLWMVMGKEGYRRQEPPELDVPQERPTLLDEIIELHRKTLGYSLTELGELLALHVPEMVRLYQLQVAPEESQRHLRAV